MRYENIFYGQLIERCNRFVARVLVDDQERLAHVRNTGRLGELLVPGADIVLREERGTNRKTACSLIGVRKGGQIVNIDSQAPNQVVYEALLAGRIGEIGRVDEARREVKFGHSRFDIGFRIGRQQGFIEVKGVTLEQDGTALFPDAPTERGTRHIEQLLTATAEGYVGYIFFLVKLAGAKCFRPNAATDPAFAAALAKAAAGGVGILAYDAVIAADSIVLGRPVAVELG